MSLRGRSTVLRSQMRSACVKHDGYEWATEGDSFLLAFHTPVDAIMFAADVQVRGILDAAYAACRWCV
jgi:class 3 adenylate cyclase